MWVDTTKTMIKETNEEMATDLQLYLEWKWRQGWMNEKLHKYLTSSRNKTPHESRPH